MARSRTSPTTPRAGSAAPAPSQNGGAERRSPYHLPGRGRGRRHRRRRRPDHRLVQRPRPAGPRRRIRAAAFPAYLYDNNGNLVSYTDAAGNTYQYTYDQNGNLTQTVNPLGQTVQHDLRLAEQPDLDHRRRRQHDPVQLQLRRQPAQHHLPRRHSAVVHLRSARQPERDHRAERRPGQLPVQRPGPGHAGRPSPTAPARPSPTTPTATC